MGLGYLLSRLEYFLKQAIESRTLLDDYRTKTILHSKDVLETTDFDIHWWLPFFQQTCI